MVTIELLTAMCPKTKRSILEGFVEPLNTVAEYYEMFENPRRCAGFLAQIAHESGGFNAVVENLNYSAKGLMGTFKKYFPNEELAKQYERKPEMIANRVYGGRMGNGDEASGEGYKFRGRGPIQLTGKDNYTACSDFLFQDDTLVQNPDMLLDPEYALHSACWFWWKNDLNNYADSADLVTMTKRINGGTIGLEDRIAHYNHAMEIFA